MIRGIFLALFGLTLVLNASTVRASEPNACEVDCPEGKVKVSFADGNEARCVCQDIGAGMDETPTGEINCSDPEDDGTCE